MEHFCASHTCDRGNGMPRRLGEKRYKRHWCSVSCWQDSDIRIRKSMAEARKRWRKVPRYVEDTEPRGKPTMGGKPE